jgi:hypothetical protein
MVLAGFVGIACSTPSASSTPALSPTPTGLGPNLLVNGDAEAGPGSPDGGVVPVPGWKPTGSFTAVQYDTPAEDYFKSSDPGPPNRGKSYFAGGPDSPSSSASQEVDVASKAKAIDAGKATFKLAGWLGGWSTQEDNAVLTITFADANGSGVGTASIGPVTAADRQGKTSLIYKEATGSVPGGTRKIKVVLLMTRLEGVYNDGYADNLSLQVAG